MQLSNSGTAAGRRNQQTRGAARRLTGPAIIRSITQTPSRQAYDLALMRTQATQGWADGG
jgi:hypothetical protein